jgi:hypothetical protein
MRSLMGHTGDTDAGATNPYTLAHRHEGGGRRTRDAADIPAKVLLLPVTCTRNVISRRQAQKLQRLRLTASLAALEQSEALERGSAAFIARNTPTAGDLVEFTQLDTSQWEGSVQWKVADSGPLASA